MPKSYPREFHDDVVRVARDRDPGLTVEQIANDFGVHPMTLFKWLRQAGAGHAEVKPLATGVALGIVAGGSAVNGDTDPARNPIIMLTAVDTRDGWRSASLQNTRVSDLRADR